MKRLQFVCDGCEKTTNIGVPGGYPVGWSPRQATVDPQNAVITEFDLCGACFRHFNDVADPKSWPRIAEAK